MRLCVWRLLVLDCPGDNDLCTSGAETDCGKENVFSGGDSGEGGNTDRRGENDLDKGDRSGGEKSLGFVDSDFVLEWDGGLREVLPLPLRFALFPKLVLYGPAEGGWYWVGGKDCEAGIPIVRGLVPTPGVE